MRCEVAFRIVIWDMRLHMSNELVCINQALCDARDLFHDKHVKCAAWHVHPRAGYATCDLVIEVVGLGQGGAWWCLSDTVICWNTERIRASWIKDRFEEQFEKMCDRTQQASSARCCPWACTGLFSSKRVFSPVSQRSPGTLVPPVVRSQPSPFNKRFRSWLATPPWQDIMYIYIYIYREREGEIDS